MIDFVDEIRSKLEGMDGSIVFPEAYDQRVLKAADMLTREKFNLKIILLGNPDELSNIASENNIDISKFEIINWKNSELIEEFSEEFFELRKHKGVSKDDCHNYISNDVNAFGAMMVRKGLADGMVSGSMSPTADVIRAAIWIVQPKKGIKTVSSFFVMVSNDESIGDSGRVIFSDCAFVVDPTPEQLSDITINAAGAAKFFLNSEPMVALLSYSTFGSGSGNSVDRVRQAVKILKDRGVDFKFDGEMQFDAAISPSVASIKCPDSEVGGKANTFIFPNLDSGNIGYKIAQRIGKMKAYGPVLVGLNKPINDLSRGCSAEDIYVTSLMTLLQVKSHI
ncbi:MAG: phosphate acetyltransferase [Spirochaetia bacterium]|nr:phosphate acetyltransferase [Spirochaetota bacterium]MCX8096344.1 phosphate acetyltransferase [Spirochaetota bacterium]MDW8112295.1 phosphate acetyltransferase [Spirochaetia bacterium]